MASLSASVASSHLSSSPTDFSGLGRQGYLVIIEAEVRHDIKGQVKHPFHFLLDLSGVGKYVSVVLGKTASPEQSVKDT